MFFSSLILAHCMYFTKLLIICIKKCEEALAVKELKSRNLPELNTTSYQRHKKWQRWRKDLRAGENTGQHRGLLISTVALQQEGPEFDAWLW